ncbi:MAG: GNAT family N-acetyltransferase, partial [Alphaproteobacteria bacterium]|nr:GNAT family N-acetyltransferase [Alphaproteobacteria bacterium]
FGFSPRFLTPIMAIGARRGLTAVPSLRYGDLPEAERRESERRARELTDQLYPGLDLSAEMRTVFDRRLGDTLLLLEGDSQVAGFAVCHWGPTSEAGHGNLFVKFGAVAPGARAEERFSALLGACRELATAVGMANVVAGVNTARDAAYQHMIRVGFRTQFQGVTMHRPNEAGYSRPDLFVLDDWR